MILVQNFYKIFIKVLFIQKLFFKFDKSKIDLIDQDFTKQYSSKSYKIGLIRLFCR